MSRTYLRLVAIFVVLLIGASSAHAITRVARSLGVFDFNIGAAIPGGSYDHIGNTEFRPLFGPVDVDGDKIYNTSLTLGLSFGKVVNNHLLLSAGFQYSHWSVKDTIYAPTGDYLYWIAKPHFNQYDLNINANYQINDLEQEDWTPYLGFGFAAGISSQTLRYTQSENETNVALRMNFGAEMKIWRSADGRSFATLASANSWDFVSSGYRPRNLTIGGAIRFYMRP